MKTITLPPSALESINTNIETQTSLVIIGPNGSGKTKFGIALEKALDSKKVFRISAQKSLEIPEVVSPTDLESAKSNLMFGHYNESFDNSIRYKESGRWGNKPDTKLLDDYGKLLTYLFTDNYDSLLEFGRMSTNSSEKIEAPNTLIDSTIDIWEKVIPHRKLIVRSGYIEVIGDSVSSNYKATSMSDGERVIFYLIGHCLSAPEGGVVIIDEPEIHIHKSIQRKLWNLIEEKRKDCLFVYLTHDLEFASTRVGSVKICLREFDGNNFYWFPVPFNEDIPEETYLEILGSRRPILFIEGSTSSYDKHIYSLIYPEFTIKPLGSCEKVIQATKSFNTLNRLHDLECFGIVDRDYRPEEYVDSLKETNIFCPEVAEVENLFLVEEVLSAVALQFGTSEEKVNEIKLWVIEEFNKLKEKYALEATAAYINYNLNSFNGRTQNIEELNENLKNLYENIGVQDYYENQIIYAEGLIDRNEYNLILRVFNHKKLVSQVGKFFDIKPAVFTAKVQTIIQAQSKNGNDIILNAIKEYLPTLT